MPAYLVYQLGFLLVSDKYPSEYLWGVEDLSGFRFSWGLRFNIF